MKKNLANSLIILGTIFIFFLILDIALSIFSPSKIRIQPYHEKYDSTLGWVNKPLKNEGVHFEFAKNRFFHVTHNSLGLRGPETSYKKPEGIRRILFVGDSYFWGYGVSDDEVLTRVLQQHVPSSIEVLNGGTTGYGTDQELLWLKVEGLKYKPDIVIFSFSAANDLDEIATSVSYYSPKPIFMLDNEEFVLKNVPVPRTLETDRKTFGNPRTLFGKAKKFLRHNTHFYPFITGRLNANPAIRHFLINVGLGEEYTTIIGNIPVLKNPPDKLWGIALSLIKEGRKIAEDSGAKFVLAFIPEKETALTDNMTMPDAQRKTCVRNDELSSLFREFTKKEKISYIDFLPIAREHLRIGASLYNTEPTDHHWNASGHRFAAHEILTLLEKQRWLSPQ